MASLSMWQGQKESNPQPMVLETTTLPVELYPYENQRLPILPGRFHPSTFGVCGLNYCVRHGNRWIPAAIATEFLFSRFFYPDNRIEKCLLFLITLGVANFLCASLSL